MLRILKKNKLNSIHLNHGLLIRFLIWYTLALFGFSFIYYKIYKSDPKSFSKRDTKDGYPLFDFFHFSLVTQTTVGYGDMIPLSLNAKIANTIHLLLIYAIFVISLL